MQPLAAVRHMLIVDVDAAFAQVLGKYLYSHDVQVIATRSAAEGTELISDSACDLVVLDPREQDSEVGPLLTTIASRGIPLTIASSERGETDRVVALELGADDYVVKPVALREFLARIHVIERRLLRASARAVPHETAKFGRWTFRPISRSAISPQGHHLVLTPAEGAVLLALLEHPHEALTRERIVALTHGDAPNANARTVDVIVGRLRRKLSDSPREPQLILTVRSLGYQIGYDVLWT